MPLLQTWQIDSFVGYKLLQFKILTFLQPKENNFNISQTKFLQNLNPNNAFFAKTPHQNSIIGQALRRILLKPHIFNFLTVRDFYTVET